MGNPEYEYQAPLGPPPSQANPSDVPAPLRSHPSSQYTPPPPEQGEMCSLQQSNFTPSLHNFNPDMPSTDSEDQYASQHQGTSSANEQWVPSASQAPQEQSQGAPATTQKVSLVDQAKKDGRKAFDMAWNGVMKLGGPVNKFTNKIGSEAFWPSTMDKESDKAARILKSFCKDGFYADPPKTDLPVDGPKNKQKVLVKIPQKVIQNAVGLAIFSTMRTGLWISGSGGSGVLIARLPDGSWSPPSGILIHTLGMGFMAGIDIYDCVLVINTYEALKAFQSFRVTLGGELSVVAGPVGAGGVLEADIRPDSRANKKTARQGEPLDPTTTAILQAQDKEKRSRKPVFTYMKSRGLYLGIQVDGTFILERNDENAAFYGEKVRVAEILKAQVRTVPASTRMLMEVLKAAEGRETDTQMMIEVASQPAPSDVPVHKTHEASHDQKVAYGPDAQAQARLSAVIPPIEKHPALQETYHDQKVRFDETPHNIPEASSSSSAQPSHSNQHDDDFPPYNPADFGSKSQGDTALDRELHDLAVQDYSVPPPEGDAELAARLQAEEHERVRAIEEDRGPAKPPRPVSVPPPYEEASSSGGASGYPADNKGGSSPRYG